MLLGDFLTLTAFRMFPLHCFYSPLFEVKLQFSYPPHYQQISVDSIFVDQTAYVDTGLKLSINSIFIFVFVVYDKKVTAQFCKTILYVRRTAFRFIVFRIKLEFWNCLNGIESLGSKGNKLF